MPFSYGFLSCETISPRRLCLVPVETDTWSIVIVFSNSTTAPLVVLVTETWSLSTKVSVNATVFEEMRPVAESDSLTASTGVAV
jgi:hypothetical protein